MLEKLLTVVLIKKILRCYFFWILSNKDQFPIKSVSPHPSYLHTYKKTWTRKAISAVVKGAFYWKGLQ